jgi:hypothetical protein
MKSTTLVFLLVTLSYSFAHAWRPCPDASLSEVAADCPFAPVAEILEADAANGVPLEATLVKNLPDLARQINEDAFNEAYKRLWGQSLNLDQLANGLIVAPTTLELLHSMMKAAHHETFYHAGVAHTYGYLFSRLRTSFGYKRARWVSGELERGFGLTPGLLSPNCTAGTLFSNVTYFLGRIAFRDDAMERQMVDASSQSTAKELQHYNFSQLSIQRLTESILTDNDIIIRLRTDIVRFTHSGGGLNTALLVYSISDPRESNTKLISAFPVNDSFARNLLSPKPADGQRTIATRYNAYVEGVTGRFFPPIF